MIDVVAVSNRRMRRDFVAVPISIYASDPCFVARLNVEILRHISTKNPYFAHATHQLFVAYEQGKPVGRISAQIDALAQRDAQGLLGHFGFLDAARADIVPHLFAAAEAWLKARGVTRIAGPYSFSSNDEAGLLVKGFDSAPYVLMNYAPDWMGEAVVAVGYARIKDLLAFHMDTTTPFPRAATRLAQQAHTFAGLDVRSLTPEHLQNELRSMLTIYNEAWRDNWGFIAMTPAETRYMAHNLKPLLMSDMARIASINGEPVAMIMALPNLMEVIHDLKGRLLPFGWLKLLYRLKWRGARSLRVILMGIRPEFRVGILGAMLSAKLIYDIREACLKRKVRWVEMSWILEDNLPMIRLIEAVGGQCYKRYRLYEKVVT